MDLYQWASHSLENATRFLVGQQREDGSWPGENFAGPAYTATCLCVEGYLDILSAGDAEQGVKWCRSCQFENGSYPDYLAAPSGTLDTTALVYAALKLSGVADADPAQTRALEFITTSGGFTAVCFEYRLYLAMAGLYDARQLATPTIIFKFIPGAQRMLGSRFGLEMAIASNQLPLIIRCLKDGPGISPWLHPLEALGCKRALNYLRTTQNPAGNWVGILMPTLWALLCMHYMEVSPDDEAWIRARDYLQHWKVYTDEGMRVVPYQSEIWNTALATRALIFSELPVHEAIHKGVGYLLRNQSQMTEPADWQNPAPGAPRSGGWPYEQDNPLCSDCDTTAAVLWTLSEARKREIAVDPSAIDQGLRWLLGMQNSDGGWAAFAHGLKSKAPGPMFTKPLVLPSPTLATMFKMFLNPPVEFGDPATEGLTGRVLCSLGSLDKNLADPLVEKARDFLLYQRAENGVWWGRWEVNFLAATGCVLGGLHQVGESSSAPVMRDAIKWLESKQNEDGGWGEAIESYADPVKAGTGASCGTLTAAVLSALLDSGVADKLVVERGMIYLCSGQNNEGFWEEPYPLYVMIPPNTFYSNKIYSQYSPVEALSKFVHQMNSQCLAEGEINVSVNASAFNGLEI